VLDYNSAAFGQIVFVSKNHTVPALPDMSLIVLKNDSVFQAICIDLEIDSIGNNIDNACVNLKQALHAYSAQMISNYEGNIIAASKDIIDVAFSQGESKSLLSARYLQAKHQYLINKIAKRKSEKWRGYYADK